MTNDENRWDAFTVDELRDLAHAFSVEDQEYGADSPLWAEVCEEILCREFPDPVVRAKMVDWRAAISEDHRRFPSPLDRMLMAYGPAIRSTRPFGWLEVS